MTFKQQLRKLFGPKVKVSPASRRGKSGQRPRRRSVPLLELFEDRVTPAVLMVTSLADLGVGTLRGEILASVGHISDLKGQFGTGNDTIQFSPTIDGGTINLTSFGNDLSNGTTMAGPSAFFITNNDQLVIDGQTGLTLGITIQRSTTAAAFRLFDVDNTGTLTLQSLTLANGLAQGFKGATVE